ncbi:MAG: tRNA (5-methylaminomethyl-2-thiouridine)(34)-methyltransferase MnmD [Prevotellaceae bacterium]|jgi:tRNA U34 5-methylaminomethyl-2-thiouridine-forming methyltransferase MnmC|nr:tRNA (5-methylaminomethyl-2-thiouridine)(34)-methyltransferase MnmD [Prevotellaceae bacterium]
MNNSPWNASQTPAADGHPRCRIVSTADGSYTLYLPALNEHYHSVNGAVQESLHVYIEAGLRYICKDAPHTSRRILEAGFGTGLNALLTMLEAEHSRTDIYYEAIEKYPLPLEIVTSLNYAETLRLPDSCRFMHLHNLAWEQEQRLSPHFSLCKRRVDLCAYEPDGLFDGIYFDAFAPSVQPELWTATIFRKLYNSLSDGGALVTYSAKGAVKTALRQAGFELQRLPGAAGKRHMLRAVKPHSSLLSNSDADA